MKLLVQRLPGVGLPQFLLLRPSVFPSTTNKNNNYISNLWLKGKIFASVDTNSIITKQNFEAGR